MGHGVKRDGWTGEMGKSEIIQRSEVRSRKAKVRGQRLEDRRQRATWLSVISYLLFG